MTHSHKWERTHRSQLRRWALLLDFQQACALQLLQSVLAHLSLSVHTPGDQDHLYDACAPEGIEYTVRIALKLQPRSCEETTSASGIQAQHTATSYRLFCSTMPVLSAASLGPNRLCKLCSSAGDACRHTVSEPFMFAHCQACGQANCADGCLKQCCYRTQMTFFARLWLKSALVQAAAHFGTTWS